MVVQSTIGTGFDITTPSTGNVWSRQGGVWSPRTIAQLKGDLGYADWLLVAGASDAGNGGGLNLLYGGNTNLASNTSLWRFSVNNTSDFNLTRFDSGGAQLNAIKITEAGTATFTGTVGSFQMFQGAGNVGFELRNNVGGLVYVDLSADAGTDNHARLSCTSTLLSLTAAPGVNVSISPPVTLDSAMTGNGGFFTPQSFNSSHPVPLVSNVATGGVGIIRYSIENIPLWDVGQNGEAISGGPTGRTGANWFVGAWDNSGANPIIPLFITRADGRTTFLSSGYRSGVFQANHNQSPLAGSIEVTWPAFGGRVVLQPNTAVSNGQILIGNSTGNFSRTTLTPGPGVTITNGDGTITISAASAGSTKPAQFFWPSRNEPPTSNFATFDTRSGVLVLDFDATVGELAYFKFPPLRGYGGGGLVVTLLCSMSSATSGNVVMDAAIERIDAGTDIIGALAIGPLISSTVAVPAVNGTLFTVTITFSNTELDGLTANDFWALSLSRVATSVSDTASGDLEFWGGEVREP
jgi:hypothetical protein